MTTSAGKFKVSSMTGFKSKTMYYLLRPPFSTLTNWTTLANGVT